MKKEQGVTVPIIKELVRSFFSKYHAESEMVHRVFVESTLQWLVSLWREDANKLDCIAEFLLSTNQCALLLMPEEFILSTLLSKAAPGDSKKLTEELDKYSPPITQWSLVLKRAGSSWPEGLNRLRPLIDSYIKGNRLTPFAFFTAPLFDKAYEIISLVSIILQQLEFPKDAVVISSKNLVAITNELKSWLIDIKQHRSEDKDFKYSESDVRLDEILYLLHSPYTLQNEPSLDFEFCWGDFSLDYKLFTPASLPDEKQSWKKFNLWWALKTKYETNPLRKYFGERSKAWSWQSVEIEENKRSTYRMDSIVLAYAEFITEIHKIFLKNPVTSKSWIAPIVEYLSRIEEIFKFSIFGEEKNKLTYISKRLNGFTESDEYGEFFTSIYFLTTAFNHFHEELCQIATKHIPLIKQCHEQANEIIARVRSTRERQLQACQHVVLLINDSKAARLPEGAITKRMNLVDDHLNTLIIRKKNLTGKTTYSIGFILARPILKIAGQPTEINFSHVKQGKYILLWKTPDGDYRRAVKRKFSDASWSDSSLDDSQLFSFLPKPLFNEKMKSLNQIPTGFIAFEDIMREEIYRDCREAELGLCGPELKYIEQPIENEELLKSLEELSGKQGFLTDPLIREQVFSLCVKITLSSLAKRNFELGSWFSQTFNSSSSSSSSSSSQASLTVNPVACLIC